jgi:hypothetical protein
MSQGESSWSQATKIVRKFSWKLGQDYPENEAAQAVTKYEEVTQEIEKKEGNELHDWQQWLRAMENDSVSKYVFRRCPRTNPSLTIASNEDDDNTNLERECKDLIKTWKGFEAKHAGATTSNGLPSIYSLEKTMDSVMQTMDEKKQQAFGKAKDRFREFSGTLLAYSDLFSVIPQGDKYTALFTGVISTIVKVRHPYSRPPLKVSSWH